MRTRNPRTSSTSREASVALNLARGVSSSDQETAPRPYRRQAGLSRRVIQPSSSSNASKLREACSHRATKLRIQCCKTSTHWICLFYSIALRKGMEGLNAILIPAIRSYTESCQEITAHPRWRAMEWKSQMSKSISGTCWWLSTTSLIWPEPSWLPSWTTGNQSIFQWTTQSSTRRHPSQISTSAKEWPLSSDISLCSKTTSIIWKS